MLAEAWETRAAGRLVFHYQADADLEPMLDPIIEAYQRALAELSAFLGSSASRIPTLSIYLTRFLTGSGRENPVVATHDEDHAEIWTMVSSESSGLHPELELTPLLLHRAFGPAEGERRFWYDGLAGYLAGKNGSAHHAESNDRVRRLFEVGQLPQIADLLARYSVRQSGLSNSAAIAFVGYLVERRGAERFRRLLGTLDAGSAAAFRQVYGAPLQSLEQGWYREMEEASSSASMSLLQALRMLLPYMREYRSKLLGILACILVAISFAIFMPLAIRFLTNNILGSRPLPFTLPGVAEAGQRLVSAEQQTHGLVELLTAMVLMFLLSAYANTRRSYLSATMGEGIAYDLRLRLFQHLQRLPIAYHRRTPNQDIITRFWADVGTINQALTAGVVPLTQSFLAILIFGLVMLSLNWKLSIIALAGLPIFALSYQRMRARTRETARERARRQTDVGQALAETLNAQEKVKLHGLRGYLTTRILGRLQLLRDLVVRISLLSSTSTSTSALITNGAQVAVLVTGGLIIIQSGGRDLTTGDLMAFYVILLQLYAPAGVFTNAMQVVTQSTTSLDRVNSVLQQEAREDPADSVALGPLQNNLVFEQVSYGRGKGKDLLRNLTLEIRAGTKVAFVGPPGAGKASIMELLPRLFDVAEGRITWDGTDLRSATEASLQRQLAVITQETFVFNTTIYDNIRYGRIDAGDHEIIRAAQLSGLHDFIISLPGGYDTQVNDRDSTFGLVQRQRLSVARAILQDASVILMDDALSALDAPGQRELEQVLRGPDGTRTLIRVAQRIGSVLDADAIFVMDGGQLVDQGRHDELTDRGGLYIQMLKDELGAGAVSGAFQAMRRLAKQAPFSALPPEVLEEVARLMLYAERSPGDVICRQGHVGDELFVLGRGEVEIVLEEEDGQERILNFLHEGEYFGEISFLRRVPRTATVRARNHVELHILRRQDFDQLLARLGTDVADHLDRTAQERIEATRRKLAAAEATPVLSQ